MHFESVSHLAEQMQWQGATQFQSMHTGNDTGGLGLRNGQAPMYSDLRVGELAPTEHSSMQIDQGHFQSQHSPYFQSSSTHPHGLSLNISNLSVATPPSLSPVNGYNGNGLHHSHAQGSLPSPSLTNGSSPTQHTGPDPFGHPGQQLYPLQNHLHSLQHSLQMAPPQQHRQSQQIRNGPTPVRSWPSPEESNGSAHEVSSSVPHKRSFASNQLSIPTSSPTSPVSLTPSMSETLYESMSETRRQAHFRPRLQIPDFVGGGGGEASPLDGPPSGSVYSNIGDDFEDMYSPIAENAESGPTLKPTGTNNFVSKLFGMLSEPKASQYIAWAEHGNSFIVSGVGEFSRNILGSHFKHNNFSSFVRQLNMYGFHKINRTPRSVTRGNVDGQIWEFMHQNFKRDRADLLDEVRRRMPDEASLARGKFNLVNDLPSEMQLLRDENKSMRDALQTQQERMDRVVGAFQILWEAVQTSVPGTSLGSFPRDVMDRTKEMREALEMPDIRLSTSFAPRSASSLGRSPTSESSRRKSQSQSHTRSQNHRSITRKTSLQQLAYQSHSNSPIEERMQEEDCGSMNAPGPLKRQRQSQESLHSSASLDSKFCFASPMENVTSDNIVPSIRSRHDSTPLDHGGISGRPGLRSSTPSTINTTPQIPQIGILLPPRPGMGIKHAST